VAQIPVDGHEFELRRDESKIASSERTNKQTVIDHFQVSYNLTMEKATLVMSPDFEVVDVNDYDIVLTDILKGETIRTLEIDGSSHLSEAQTSIEQIGFIERSHVWRLLKGAC
jgi:hypothetical protein